MRVAKSTPSTTPASTSPAVAERRLLVSTTQDKLWALTKIQTTLSTVFCTVMDRSLPSTTRAQLLVLELPASITQDRLWGPTAIPQGRMVLSTTTGAKIGR